MTLIDTSQYLTLSVLGRGNHPVLKVQSLDSQQLFALKKIIRDTFDHHLSDLQELMVLSSLNHRNIVKVHGFETKQITNKASKKEVYILYILMELLNANMSQEIFSRKNKMMHYTGDEMKQIVCDLLEAVDYMHSKNIAHRDLKPENILRADDGRLVLSDFNDSFRRTEIKPSAKTIVGSPYYMAPELRKAYIDGEDLADEKYDVYKADVWSLGMTFVDLATMSIGDAKSNKEKLESIRRRYGEKLRDLLADMLEVDFRKRKNIKELLNAFNEVRILDEKVPEQKIEFDFDIERLKGSHIAIDLFSLFKNKTMSLENQKKALKALQRVCELEDENKKLRGRMQEMERKAREAKPEKVKKNERKERSLLKRLTGLFCSPG